MLAKYFRSVGGFPIKLRILRSAKASAEYTGVLTVASDLELRFGKINLSRCEPLLLCALEREKNNLLARVEGRRIAGLDGGEDEELLLKINEYIRKGEKI